MVTAMDAGAIDPTKPAKYPVILSDALLGKPATEIFTGFRFNHQPTLSSETAPDIARLHQSANSSSSAQTFDLSYTDDPSKGAYKFSGTRATDANQYVLYFDVARQAFILDRVDSVFSMNMTRTPDCDDADALAQKFEHLDTTVPPVPDADEAIVSSTQTQPSTQETTTRKTGGANTVSPVKKTTKVATGQTAAARKRAEKAGREKAEREEKEKIEKEKAEKEKAAPKKEAPQKPKQPSTKRKTTTTTTISTPAPQPKLPPKPPKPVELLLPEPEPEPAPTIAARSPAIALHTVESPKSPKRNSQRRSRTPLSDDDSDDGGYLQVEYPDAPNGGQGDTALANNFSPAFQIQPRQWSELLNQGDDAQDKDNARYGSQAAEEEIDDDAMNAEFEEADNDNDDDDADVNELHLPSPVGGRMAAPHDDMEQELQQSLEFDDGEEDPLINDLTAALEAELESEVSEEE